MKPPLFFSSQSTDSAALRVRAISNGSPRKSLSDDLRDVRIGSETPLQRIERAIDEHNIQYAQSRLGAR